MPPKSGWFPLNQVGGCTKKKQLPLMAISVVDVVL
jgi:hypothetical protein